MACACCFHAKFISDSLLLCVYGYILVAGAAKEENASKDIDPNKSEIRWST